MGPKETRLGIALGKGLKVLILFLDDLHEKLKGRTRLWGYLRRFVGEVVLNRNKWKPGDFYWWSDSYFETNPTWARSLNTECVQESYLQEPRHGFRTLFPLACFEGKSIPEEELRPTLLIFEATRKNLNPKGLGLSVSSVQVVLSRPY